MVITQFLARQLPESFIPEHNSSLRAVTSLARISIHSLLQDFQGDRRYLSLANSLASRFHCLEHLSSSGAGPSDRYLYVAHYSVHPPTTSLLPSGTSHFTSGSVIFSSATIDVITLQLDHLPDQPQTRMTTFGGYHCTLSFTSLLTLLTHIQDPLTLNALLSMLCHDLVLEDDSLGDTIITIITTWHADHCPACSTYPRQTSLCRIHERIQHYIKTKCKSRSSDGSYIYPSILDIVNTPLVQSYTFYHTNFN